MIQYPNKLIRENRSFVATKPSNIDWTNAPYESTFFAGGLFRKYGYFWFDSMKIWVPSGDTHSTLLLKNDYQKRPFVSIEPFNVDWTKAPPETTFFAGGLFRKHGYFWFDSMKIWLPSGDKHSTLLLKNDYQTLT